MLEFGVNEVNAEGRLVPFVATEVSFLKGSVPWGIWCEVSLHRLLV